MSEVSSAKLFADEMSKCDSLLDQTMETYHAM